MSVGFLVMLFHEKRGHYPFMTPSAAASTEGSNNDVTDTGIEREKGNINSVTRPSGTEV